MTVGNGFQGTKASDQVWWMRFTVISSLVFVVCAVLAYPSAALVYSHLMGGGLRMVMSPSMNNSFEPGDLVVVKPVDSNDVNVGDVVTYADGNNTIINRVVGKTGSGQEQVFTFKGNNNNAPDKSVKENQIRTKVVHKMPFLGFDNGKIVYTVPHTS